MTRIETPTNARSRRTRTALLDAARLVVETDGVRSLTMAGVAEAAGVSRRSAYLHFATRSDLLVALFGHVAEIEDLAGVMAPVWAAPDAVTALDAWVDRTSRYLLGIVRVAGALRRERRDDPDVAAHWEVVSRAHRADCRRLADWLERDQRLAATWTVATATDLLWALMSVELVDDLVVEQRWSVDDYVARVQVLLRSAFVRPVPEDGRSEG